jgi:hypothetical protein
MPRKSRKKQPQPTVSEADPITDGVETEHPAPPHYPEQPSENEEPHREPIQPRPFVSWADTVREHESYGRTGIHRIETRSPDKTGIRYPDDRPPNADEKREMQDHGLGYWPEAKVWAKRATPESRDETRELAARIAERRRENEGRG